jgi:hypothetical protein
VLALSLGLVMNAFAGPEFEQASAVARMFESEGTTPGAVIVFK